MDANKTLKNAMIMVCLFYLRKQEVPRFLQGHTRFIFTNYTMSNTRKLCKNVLVREEISHCSDKLTEMKHLCRSTLVSFYFLKSLLVVIKSNLYDRCPHKVISWKTMKQKHAGLTWLGEPSLTIEKSEAFVVYYSFQAHSTPHYSHPAQCQVK